MRRKNFSSTGFCCCIGYIVCCCCYCLVGLSVECECVCVCLHMCPPMLCMVEFGWWGSGFRSLCLLNKHSPTVPPHQPCCPGFLILLLPELSYFLRKARTKSNEPPGPQSSLLWLWPWSLDPTQPFCVLFPWSREASLDGQESDDLWRSASGWEFGWRFPGCHTSVLLRAWMVMRPFLKPAFVMGTLFTVRHVWWPCPPSQLVKK